MDNKNSSQDHLWEPCPKGMLLKVVELCSEKNNLSADHLWEPCPQGMLVQVADSCSKQIRDRKSQAGSATKASTPQFLQRATAVSRAGLSARISRSTFKKA